MRTGLGNLVQQRRLENEDGVRNPVQQGGKFVEKEIFARLDV